jgi:inhibitor of KinA sporulation pathway (predicted exonuclease)
MKNKRYSHAIVLDFEATCSDGMAPTPQEIIEFPSVLINLENLEVEDEFESFVRPVHHPKLTSFCTDLTSIRQEDVDAAEPFSLVFKRHQSWLRKRNLSASNALMVTCGDWDLRTMLPTQCRATSPATENLPPIYCSWLNIKKLFAETTRRKGGGMKSMLSKLDLSLEGRHHRGIDDCRNIGRILTNLLRRGARPKPTMSLSAKHFPPLSIVLKTSDLAIAAVINRRNISVLHSTAGKLLKRKIDGFSLVANGRHLKADADLCFLASGSAVNVHLA